MSQQNITHVSNNSPKNIGQLLALQKTQIAAALPKHLTPDRMLRIVMTEIRKNPKLKDCTPESLIGAVIQCSQLGLEPGNSLGHAYLIPYGKECQFMIGYRGMIDLARRSGQIISLNAHCIYANDKFELEYGLEEKLKHIPTMSERGVLVGAYAIAHLKGGGYQIEVMFKNEIDKIRSRSNAANKGPWVTDYPEQARKTVVRKIFKYLPVSIEIQTAALLDEAGDRGEQNNSALLEGEFDVMSDDIVETSKSSKAAQIANILNTKTQTKEKETDASAEHDDFLKAYDETTNQDIPQ